MGGGQSRVTWREGAMGVRENRGEMTFCLGGSDLLLLLVLGGGWTSC